MNRIALSLSLVAALACGTSALAATKKTAAKAATPVAALKPAIKYLPLGDPKFPISAGAIVPAGSEIFFVSGIPGSAATGDTEAQTAEVLTKLGKVLTDNGYAYSDVVNAKVYLVGDPKKDGRMDFAGMNASFAKVFGTADQPHKPSRVTVQVASLAGPGSLVEIELTAAKAPK